MAGGVMTVSKQSLDAELRRASRASGQLEQLELTVEVLTDVIRTLLLCDHYHWNMAWADTIGGKRCPYCHERCFHDDKL